MKNILFDRWGIYYDDKRQSWVSNQEIKCSFTHRTIDRAIVVRVRNEILGITDSNNLQNEMDRLFNEDKSLESIELLPVNYK